MFVECELSSPSGHQTCPWSETEQESDIASLSSVFVISPSRPEIKMLEIGQHGHWTDRYGKERICGGMGGIRYVSDASFLMP